MPKSLSERIEQIIYDYVYDEFGPSEASDPSWNIPALAEHLAERVNDETYEPRHEIQYDT